MSAPTEQFKIDFLAMMAQTMQNWGNIGVAGAGPAVPPPCVPAVPPMPMFQPPANIAVNPNTRNICPPRTLDETEAYTKALVSKQVSKANMSTRQEHAMEVLVKYRQDKQKASRQQAGPASKKARRVQEDEDEALPIEDEDEVVIEDEEVAEELAIEPPAAEDDERVLPDPPAEAGVVPMPTEKQKRGFEYALTKLYVTEDFPKDRDFIKLLEQIQLGNYSVRKNVLSLKQAVVAMIKANELVRPGYIAWALTIGEGIGETNWAAPESPEDEARFEAFRKKLIRGKSFDKIVPDDLKWRRLNK